MSEAVTVPNLMMMTNTVIVSEESHLDMIMMMMSNETMFPFFTDSPAHKMT